jgi:hypothetical protein
VAGWFSFRNGHATAGDLLSGDLLREWLAAEEIPTDIATDPPFTGGVDWRQVDPEAYSHLIFVCGPWGRGELEAEILLRFATCRLIGLNLSMSLPLEAWNPFDFLIERDSVAGANVDMVFGGTSPLPPVLGVCLVEDHPEAEVARANRIIEDFLADRELARVRIDTRLDENEVGLRTPGEVEALIARMDVLVTTRLHGLVLALKNGVPAIAVDAVPGGGKISRQCSLVGWPIVFTLDRLDQAAFESALARALGPGARALARECSVRAVDALQVVRSRLLAALASDSTTEGRFERRTGADQIEEFRATLRELLTPEEPEQPVRPVQKPRRRLWRLAGSMLSRF